MLCVCISLHIVCLYNVCILRLLCVDVLCMCVCYVCVCVCEYLCVCVFICHKVKVFNFQYLLTPGADLRGRLRGFLRQEEGLKGEIYPPL